MEKDNTKKKCPVCKITDITGENKTCSEKCFNIFCTAPPVKLIPQYLHHCTKCKKYALSHLIKRQCTVCNKTNRGTYLNPNDFVTKN